MRTYVGAKVEWKVIIAGCWEFLIVNRSSFKEKEKQRKG